MVELSHNLHKDEFVINGNPTNFIEEQIVKLMEKQVKDHLRSGNGT